MLYMQDFIGKISAKNVFIIIKTCSASGGSAPVPRFGGVALPPNPHLGFCPWTPLEDFRPQSAPDLPITSTGFPVPPDRRGLKETLGDNVDSFGNDVETERVKGS